MITKIVDGTYPDIHSVVIIKDGKLVLEEYFYEYDINKLHQLRSATKNFVSSLVGNTFLLIDPGLHVMMMMTILKAMKLRCIIQMTGLNSF